jgi:hypothetical protein
MGRRGIGHIYSFYIGVADLYAGQGLSASDQDYQTTRAAHPRNWAALVSDSTHFEPGAPESPLTSYP